MSIYKRHQGKHVPTYTKVSENGKSRFIKKSDIPGNIMTLLETETEVNDENLKYEAPLKECIFCKHGAKMSRLVDGQHVYVCDEHYVDTTLGQVAQALRENSTDALLVE